MPSNRDYQERYIKKDQECRKYKALYAELKLKVDENEGRLAKEATRQIDNAITLMSTATLHLQGLLKEMKPVPLPKEERDRHRKYLGAQMARVSSGPGLSKVRKPSSKFAKSAVRMPTLHPQKNNDGSDDDDNENPEDAEDEKESSEDEDEEEAGDGAQVAAAQHPMPMPVPTGGVNGLGVNYGYFGMHGQQAMTGLQGMTYTLPGTSHAQPGAPLQQFDPYGWTQQQFQYGGPQQAGFSASDQNMPPGPATQLPKP